MFPLLVAWILLIDVLVQAAPTRPPTRSPTRSPTRFPTRSPTRAPTRTRSPTGSRSPTTTVNTVKGWVYLTSYADSSCSSMKNATGTPIETCLFDQSTSTYFQYTCVSGQPAKYTYSDASCLSTPNITTIDTGCIGSMKSRCTNTYNLPLSTDYALVYTYKESNCINPISFTATVNGACNSDKSMYAYPNIRSYSNGDCTSSYSTQSLSTCSNGKRMTLGGDLGAQSTYSPTAAPTPAVVTLKGTMKISRIKVTSYSQSDKQALFLSAKAALISTLNIDASYIADLYFTQLTSGSSSSSSSSVMAIQFTLKGSIDYFRTQLNVASSIPNDVALKVSSILNTNTGSSYMTSLRSNLNNNNNGGSSTIKYDFQYYSTYQTTSTTASTSSTSSSSSSSSSKKSGGSTGIIAGVIIPIVGLVVASGFYYYKKRMNTTVNPGNNVNVTAPAGTNYPFNPAVAKAPNASAVYPINNVGNVGPYVAGAPPQYAQYVQPFPNATPVQGNSYGMVGGFPPASLPQQQQYGATSYNPNMNQAPAYPNGGGFILPYSANNSAPSYGVTSTTGDGNMTVSAPNQVNNNNTTQGIVVGGSNHIQTNTVASTAFPDTFTF